MRNVTGFALGAFCLFAAASPSRAQMASIAPPTSASPPGWSFAITPYLWLPTISADLEPSGPRGQTVTTTVDAGIGDYISNINFGMMVGGAVRYDRFSAMTDLMYLNASFTSNVSHLSSVNPGSGPIDISRSLQLGTGTRMATTIWSLAGGYTLLQGDWGYLDAVAGFRMLAIDSTTNYQLGADILAPDRTIAMSRGGSLTVNQTLFNAIGGITGRINIPNSKFYLPFYFDAGGGALPLTWQAYGGISYRATDWTDVSLGYRYLAFEGSSSSGIRNLSMGGVILAANIRF